eukprot:UN02664
MEEEEFQIHIATKHPSLVNELLTQTIMASFHNPDILKKCDNNNNNINTKKRRKKDQTNGIVMCALSKTQRQKVGAWSVKLQNKPNIDTISLN